jgi:hypothetical protein
VRSGHEQVALARNVVGPVPQVVHRPSHRELLRPLPEVPRLGGGFDAVLVPSVRGAELLGAAVTLAEAEQCALVVMCSGATAGDEVWWRLPSCGGAAVDWPAFAREVIPSLRTPRLAESSARAYAETAAKRNFSLLLARLMGWEYVVFMDDDVSPPAPAELRRAAAALSDGELRAVSWAVARYPDNSVVCHAHRAVGGHQDTFVGSGMLAIDVRGPLPFFPPVYNEDWLFLYDFVAQERVAYGGNVRQHDHDPFADPRRAAAQEFGDVLGEGVFELLHRRRPVSVACFPQYWDAVLAGRRQLLDRIEHRLLEVGCHSRETSLVDRQLRSLAAARISLGRITARALADFVAAWRHDLYVWNAFLARLPRLGSLPEALSWLGLPDHHVADSRLTAELPA